MPWIIAHRGASAYEPENTLRAFHRAIDLGADMIELDVHLSGDGEVVVIHDEELSRTTDGSGRVSDYTLDELRRFDAGKGEPIPTLQEVVDLVRGRCRLYVELKGAGTPRPVAALIRANRFEALTIVGSFQPALIRQLRALGRPIATSLLVGPDSRDPVAEALAAGARYVHLCWENRSDQPAQFLTPDLLARIRHHGLGVILWHEEREEVIQALRGLDVDGVCSNRPDLLRAILAAPDGRG
jgi:glycerophosphoryl diester phosphodiesterase